MKRILAVLLCLLIPSISFASNDENSYKVTYDGGSVIGVKAGNDVKLVITEKAIQLVKGKNILSEIPAASFTEISYGQDVHRRVGAAIGIGVFTLGIGALMALTKSKKHFVGVTWKDGDKKGGFVMQCDKNEYRGILAALEGISGMKAVNSDTMNVKS